jgi:hypothetical protein
MPVVVVADHHFKPDALAGGLAQLVALLPETRALEGCLDIQVLQDQDDANHVGACGRPHVIRGMANGDGDARGTSHGFTQAPIITYLKARSDFA